MYKYKKNLKHVIKFRSNSSSKAKKQLIKTKTSSLETGCGFTQAKL